MTSLPTPATVRTALAEAERIRLARWEGEYAHIVREIAKESSAAYKPIDGGKLCAKHYINSSVLDPAFRPWLQEHLTRDNPAWNVSLVHDPPTAGAYDDSDYESYIITMIEK
jgi:hypothetical protein